MLSVIFNAMTYLHGIEFIDQKWNFAPRFLCHLLLENRTVASIFSEMKNLILFCLSLIHYLSAEFDCLMWAGFIL